MFRSVITLLVAATAFAQTPPGSYAHTKHALGAAYQNATIIPGIWISPNDVGDQPAIWPATKEMRKDTKYMLLMMDLNIPDSDVTTTVYYDTLVPGLAPKTTTRLHWWGGNYTIEDGRFVNSSVGLAPYTAPRPRDSTNHTYALYLFDQPASYVPSKAALDGTYYSEIGDARFNFSLAPIVEAVGEPVAATYFLSDEV